MDTEFAFRVAETSDAGSEGCSVKRRATAPATCGVAIDVPDIWLVQVSQVCQADFTLEPGA